MSYLENISLVNRIKVFTILGAKSNDSFNFNSNLLSNDPIKLLLDLLGTILGTGFIKTLFAKLIVSFIKELEPLIKDQFKRNNISNSSNQPTYNFLLPVPMSLLDFNDMFKQDPNTVEGRNLMPNNSFQFDFYNNVLNGNNNGNYFSNQMNVNYSNSTNIALISNNNPISTLSRQKQLDLMVDSIPLLDANFIAVMVIDAIFGNISKKKSINGIKNDLLLDNIINNIIEDKDDKETFSLTIENLQKLNDDANKIKKGINVLDFGCGETNLSLPNNFLDDNINIDLVLKVESALNTSLNNSGVANNEAITNNYYNNITKKLLLIMIKNLLFSPQMIIFLLVQNKLIHNKYININTNININEIINIIELIKDNFGLIKFLICYIKNRFLEYMFNFFKTQLLKLILPVLKKILIEKLIAYKKSITSLVKPK